MVGFSQTQLEAMLDAASAPLLTGDGRTVISYSVGGKSVTKSFTIPQTQLLLEIGAALQRLDPATYGQKVTRTRGVFS